MKFRLKCLPWFDWVPVVLISSANAALISVAVWLGVAEPLEL